MKKTIIFLLFLTSHASLAVETANVTRNDEVKVCEEKYGDENSECLGDIEDKSTETLNKTYADKLKEMENFDYTQWWMGDEERKKRMIELFKKTRPNGSNIVMIIATLQRRVHRARTILVMLQQGAQSI
jgi:uncharacterized protein YecT (DUF1311 family)